MNGAQRLVTVPLLALIACTPAARPIPRISATPSPAASPAQTRTSPPPTDTRTNVPIAPSTPSPEGASGLFTIEIGDDLFTPIQLAVKAGTSVTWVNHGQNPHTATARDDAFASPTLLYGGAWTYTFTKPGRYRYTCLFHLNMSGEVNVE